MTWFYNNEGAAEGPLEDSAMLALVSNGVVRAQTLVWHSGLESWDDAGTLNPTWWQPEIPKSAPKKIDGTVTGSKLSHRSPVPLAPSEAPAKPKSKGLLKRLFGGK